MNEENRSLDFKMRPEQEAAVEKTAAYFKSFRKENHGQAAALPLERQNAVRKDLCRLSACQKDGLAKGAGADLQAGGAKRLGRRFEMPH